MRAAFAIVAVLFATEGAMAQSYYCDRPRKPYIPIGIGDDYNSMQMAEYDVDRYLKRMKEYVECLSSEQGDAIDENNRVLRNWNDAVDTFNRQ